MTTVHAGPPTETFGPYLLRGLIGRGGMGEVHRAVDTSHGGRTVALKLLPPALSDDSGRRARFRQESEIVARLGEPHVIPVHTYGEFDGRLFLDMQLVDGPDLGAYLVACGPLPPEVAVAIVEQVGEALDAAHAAGLVHGDVKPSNVLVHRPVPGRVPDVVLADFGVAGGRAGFGTIEYLAPERIRGEPDDRRADIYALACVLHELITGTRAFPGEFAAQVHGHLHRPPPRPSSVVATVPPALDAVVAGGMAKNPDRRPPTAGAFAGHARAALVPAGPGRPTRRQVLVSAAAGMLVLGGGVGVVSVLGSGGPEAGPDEPLPFGLGPRPEPVVTERTLGVRSTESAPLVLSAAGGSAVAVVFSPDGIQGWDLVSDVPVGPLFPVGTSGGIANDPRHIAVAEADGGPVLCSVAFGEAAIAPAHLRTGAPAGPPLTPTGAPVESVAAAVVDGAPIVVALDENKALARVDLRTARPLGPPVPLPGARVLVPMQVVEIDGRALLAGPDATIRDVATLEVVGHGSTYETSVTELHGAPVALANLGTGFGQVDIATGEVLREVREPGIVEVAAAVVAGRLVAVAGTDTGQIVLYDVATGTPIGAPLSGHEARITALQVIRLGDRPVLASAGEDNAIRVWDIAVRAHGG